MQKLGVQTQLLPPGDIFPALERGLIDAMALAFPSVDLKQGFHQGAKHYYFPGWHPQSSVGERR
jgi:TRAP-type mannitol/chloroaromatic compound transport system substrate-binding protein